MRQGRRPIGLTPANGSIVLIHVVSMHAGSLIFVLVKRSIMVYDKLVVTQIINFTLSKQIKQRIILGQSDLILTVLISVYYVEWRHVTVRSLT